MLLIRPCLLERPCIHSEQPEISSSYHTIRDGRAKATTKKGPVLAPARRHPPLSSAVLGMRCYPQICICQLFTCRLSLFPVTEICENLSNEWMCHKGGKCTSELKSGQHKRTKLKALRGELTSKLLLPVLLSLPPATSPFSLRPKVEKSWDLIQRVALPSQP